MCYSLGTSGAGTCALPRPHLAGTQLAVGGFATLATLEQGWMGASDPEDSFLSGRSGRKQRCPSLVLRPLLVEVVAVEQP